MRTILIFLAIASAGFAQTSGTIIFFNAGYEDSEFLVKWSISDPKDVSKFIISRKNSQDDQFRNVCEVPYANFRKRSTEDSVEVLSYVCTDKPEENGVYFYSLSVIDQSGRETGYPTILKIGITDVPEFKLNQNNPNPFNPSTTISYEVLLPTHVKISVFTLTGQSIDVLVDGFHTAGNYSVVFNASRYSELSSGIYFYKLETEYSSDIRKMIFAK